MAINGVPKAQRTEPMITDMIEQAARIYVLESAYQGGPACVQPKWIGTEDFISIARDMATELGTRFDSHVDKPTGMAAVRFNLGYPVGTHIGSPEAKSWLESNPGILELNRA